MIHKVKTRVRKAVIPAAGYGTRFLPFTKASPKEMLPIVDKPVIQYVVEEAVAAGIEEVIFITSSNKRTLEDHFDYNFELEEKLKRAGKLEAYEQIRAISDQARFVYLRQKEPRGNGHAVLVAKDLVGDEPFLVLWGDEFVTATPPRATQLVTAFQEKNAPVITVIRTDNPEDTTKYGFIEPEGDNGLYKVKSLVEKPGVGQAPSNLASIGGYVLTPEIFPILESLPERNHEIWLPEAIGALARERDVYARELKDAVFYDSGSKFGFIKANLDFGLRHPETKAALREYLRQWQDNSTDESPSP